MLSPGESPPSPLTVESSSAPESVSARDVYNTRRLVPYIELPQLAPEERVKYEAASSRDLPQDFDYDLPLSDRVIIGEYRDDTILWYYVENADGILHRVSVLLTVSMLGGNIPSQLTLLHSLKRMPLQRHSLVLSPSTVSKHPSSPLHA